MDWLETDFVSAVQTRHMAVNKAGIKITWRQSIVYNYESELSLKHSQVLRIQVKKQAPVEVGEMWSKRFYIWLIASPKPTELIDP